MTARTGIEEKLRALSLGAVDCIFKPFRIEELLYRVGGLVKLRDLQRELRGAERLASLGLLSGAICHEVLNPLSVIRGSLRNASILIERGQAADLERLPAFLDYADRSATRIERTVRALRSSFAEGGSPRLEELGLRGILEGLAEDARRSISKEARVEVDCPEGLVVSADGAALSTALACLVDNAAKALGGGSGRLRLAAGPGRRGPEILIEDTGPGIPPERLRSIREGRSASSKSEGMGFGILLAGELLGRQGYRLDFESALGAGTRVLVRPLARA
jgi:C4-dicarboxylate-specific signal transduction histidine kinase